jgi:hypothetical protein
MMLMGYIAQLEKLASAANAEKRSGPTPSATTYTPLLTQLERLFATMPENQRRRDFTVAELIPRLKGEFRAHPSAAGVAAALRQLGFTQRRDYSRAGGGARVWRRGE